jgi:hypothetical protein
MPGYSSRPAGRPALGGQSLISSEGELMKRLLGLLAIAGVAGCTGAASLPGAPTAMVNAATAGATGEALRAPSAVPVVGGCNVFPANNPWNTDISKYPLDPKSSVYMKSMAASSTNLHPDFGHDPDYGIPFVVVPKSQKPVPVSFDYASQSDKGPYPIPANAPIEGGSNSSGDRHVLVLQEGTCKLYELYDAYPHDGGKSWTAGSGAVFNLASNALRPNGWTSADAAGLPITPALIKCAEVKAGVINHALRFTVNNTQNGYIHPATHFAGSNDDSLPPMGLRVRLKAGFSIAKFTGASKIILVAMKKYGMLLADNGSNWYFQGEGGSAASCWNDNDLDQLKSVSASNFEVVKTGSILRISGP